jgi:RNA-directed DNA polymerase
MISDSYACRKGKGQHASLRRARHFVRRFGWFLKMDVKSFFPSVEHGVMLEALARILKDSRVLSLCRAILRGPPEDPPSSQGLPIGSLTSQWFANVLLDRLDHHVRESLRIPGYLRYMDDFVLFADSRERLLQARAEVTAYLRDPLALAPKDRATMLAPASEGLPFLGWMVHRGTLRVRHGNLRRYRWRLRQRRWEMATGRRSLASYRAGVASIFELLGAGQTLGLRRRLAEEVAMEM